MMLAALPAENVPANEKPLSLPKWPLPTWVYEPPLSEDAQTRTSEFVRAAVEADELFQAVAVYDTLPLQSIVALTSEWHAAADEASQPAMHTRHSNAKRPRFTFAPLSTSTCGG
jgi:hypothetical protein